MSDSNAVVYLPIKSENNYWATDITGFKWGSELPSDTTEYKLSATFSLHDTGSSCIIGPNA